MYRYIKAIAAMAISAALFLASRPCVYANNDYLGYTNPETEMEATTSTTVTVDYVGNFVYENGTLTKILFEGGYVDMTGSTLKYMYYLTDHLGNVRVVADSDGNIAQVNHYYPYGDRFDDSRYALASSLSSSSTDRFFGGKELDTSSALYDFEARYDNTMFGRFTTMDPMAEKYYSMSPYSYCGGNPIIMIDKSGKDIWKVNELGCLTVSQDKTKDQFIASNGKSLSLPYGTIEHSGKYDYNGKQSYVFLRVRGDDNGTQLFKFLAQNTNVEWSQAMMGKEGDDGLNFITSSHSREAEDGMTYLVKWQLQHGYTGRRFDHSHPNNDASPSGIGDNYTGDISFADYVRRHVNGDNIIFHIYTPGDSTYHEYDEYTDINTISESCITGEKLKINGLNWPWD